MSSGETFLELTDVRKRYGGGANATEVLRGVSLSAAAGEALAIVGPSGSGKSTLLNIVGALDTPDAGVVRLDGQDLAGLKDDDLATLRSRCIGFVFQSHHLLPQLTALENVLVPTLVADRSSAAGAADRAAELLTHVGLGDRLTHRPGQLSGGECQRVAVVRALINEPALLLADEPTGSLDATAADDIGVLLAEVNAERGVTLIVVTHSERLAARMGRVIALRDGRLDPRGPTNPPPTRTPPTRRAPT